MAHRLNVPWTSPARIRSRMSSRRKTSSAGTMVRASRCYWSCCCTMMITIRGTGKCSTATTTGWDGSSGDHRYGQCGTGLCSYPSLADRWTGQNRYHWSCFGTTSSQSNSTCHSCWSTWTFASLIHDQGTTRTDQTERRTSETQAGWLRSDRTERCGETGTTAKTTDRIIAENCRNKSVDLYPMFRTLSSSCSSSFSSRERRKGTVLVFTILAATQANQRKQDGRKRRLRADRASSD